MQNRNEDPITGRALADPDVARSERSPCSTGI
jgi:hypothetical protein